MLETGAPPNAREKRLSQGSHLPREKRGLTGPLHCLCFWWIYGERAGNRALHHPRGGEKNLKFVFLFCFYHQSPMRATKISHKNTCLLEQRPKLPRRSTIYLNHTAGLEDGVSPPPQRNKGTWHQQLFTSASWHSHHRDSVENCFSLPGELKSGRRVGLLLFHHLCDWFVSSQTASPAVPPRPLLSQLPVGHSVLVYYDPNQTQVHSELDTLSTLGKSESVLHALNQDLRKLRQFGVGWWKLQMCKLFVSIEKWIGIFF